MRGNLSPNEDISGYYSMMPVSDFHAKPSCTMEPADSMCGAGGAVTARPLMENTSSWQHSGDGGCAQDGPEELNEKTVLAPPVFVFQKSFTLSMKRRAERWEEGSVVGISPNKRVRSFTYPNPNSRMRKGSCDGSRRVRTNSHSFPPPPPVTPLNRVRRSLLQPARLLAPQPWNISLQPHLSEVFYNSLRPLTQSETRKLSQVSHDPSNDVSSISTDRPPTVGVLHQKKPHQVHRSMPDGTTSDRVQFVFGENMSERVLRPQKSPSSEDSDCSSDSDSSTSDSSHKGAVWSSLRESAAAYTASCGRQHVLRLRRVQLFTGEEKESNVVQLTCRLFVLEKGTPSWTERGRGVLRLNDLASGTKRGLQSRIVMRHQGSLKVILNTKLWPHTHLRRPARRNLQVTATDVETQAVRVFLIQASARDVARLYVAIHHRLVALRASAAEREAEAAGGRTREGHCNSENEEEEEEERQQKEREERLLLTRLRPVVCDWIHSKPSLDSW
ncbi:ran-binding protein 3-like isoform X3 [Salvelinus namaycush]|uniref:Ran-binding protein 3-like isoform X3 n=1 Tax=Salvelinus namaycush TaxID=8040 RepID=A0A8U0QPN8_SALNM|nr:ran-binding protein 3-like isoform X3 [Salvelinus namaycush]